LALQIGGDRFRARAAESRHGDVRRIVARLRRQACGARGALMGALQRFKRIARGDGGEDRPRLPSTEAAKRVDPELEGRGGNVAETMSEKIQSACKKGVDSYIEENLSEKISFEELASQLAVSRRNFDRRFIRATGNTPVEYLQRVKVEVAKKTLEQGRKTIFETMNEVGYTDDKAFREVFRKITGLSPLDYRSKFNKEPAAV